MRYLCGTRAFLHLISGDTSTPASRWEHALGRPELVHVSAASIALLAAQFSTGEIPDARRWERALSDAVKSFSRAEQIVPVDAEVATAYADLEAAAIQMEDVALEGSQLPPGPLQRLVLATALAKRMTLVDYLTPFSSTIVAVHNLEAIWLDEE